MPTVLEQLRAAQRDAGIVAPTHSEEVIRVGADGLPAVKSVEPLKPDTILIMPGRMVGLGAGGYIKIFPPTVQSIRDLTPEWIEVNWKTPSPWCRMEGQPDHPEFEANLAGVER